MRFRTFLAFFADPGYKTPPPAEALRRLLSLALAKAREAGIIAEDAVLALIDAVMSFAIDMLQTGKRLQLVNSELAVS